MELLLQNESFKHGFSYGTTYQVLTCTKNLKRTMNEIENESFFKKSFVEALAEVELKTFLFEVKSKEYWAKRVRSRG